MTNKEKFIEVFGFGTETDAMCPEEFDCEGIECRECIYNGNWWNKEYKPSDREVEE